MGKLLLGLVKLLFKLVVFLLTEQWPEANRETAHKKAGRQRAQQKQPSAPRGRAKLFDRQLLARASPRKSEPSTHDGEPYGDEGLAFGGEGRVFGHEGEGRNGEGGTRSSTQLVRARKEQAARLRTRTGVGLAQVPRTLAQSFRDPRSVRSALAFGAALAPRPHRRLTR